MRDTLIIGLLLAMPVAVILASAALALLAWQAAPPAAAGTRRRVARAYRSIMVLTMIVVRTIGVVLRGRAAGASVSFSDLRIARRR